MPVYTARHLLPVSSPPLTDAAVAVDEGRIVAAGPRQEVLEALPDAEVRELGDVAVLPGLVNAHTHLELSWMADDPPPGGDYVGWVRGLIERRAVEVEERAAEAARIGLERMAERGTVAVGDVGNKSWIAPLLARSGLHGISFHEIYGFRASDAETQLHAAVERLAGIKAQPDVSAARDRLRIALTAHAPHTTSAALLRAVAGLAEISGEMLSIHAAESEAEVALLADGGGPFPALFRERDFWDEEWEAPRHTPLEHLDRAGALTERTLAVHCVHVAGQDHSLLQARRSTVVTCPRSNRYLCAGVAPVPKLLGEGIPVALGTDSLASAPDLDLFAEMAALREEHPSLKPAAILRIATLNGAEALQLGGELGSIESGKRAELLVVPLEDGQEPLEAICSNPATVFRLANAPLKEPEPLPEEAEAPPEETEAPPEDADS